MQSTQRLQRAAFEARYEALDNLHITLAFLGNVDASRIDAVATVLDRVAARFQRFDMQLDTLAAFPNERRPRIVYLGSRAPSRAFASLAHALREEFRTLGFTFHDDAVAHMTIARVKGGSTRPLPLLEVEPIVVAVPAITLFESVSENGTTRYVVRHSASLLPPARSASAVE